MKGVAGGNFLILAESQATALAAAEAATDAIARVPGVILPFPGGVVRSGSKVGSKYKALRASTNDAYCPTLRGVGGQRAARRRQRGVRAGHRRARPGVRGSGDAGGRRRRRAARACGGSPPATTAASSAHHHLRTSL